MCRQQFVKSARLTFGYKLTNNVATLMKRMLYVLCPLLLIII